MVPTNLYFQDNDKVLYTLQSTEAQLGNIKPVYIKEYVEALLAAKIAKTETSLNRVCDCRLAQFYMFIFTLIFIINFSLISLLLQCYSVPQ